jgi:arginyl-tRNA--protein-N-Asp/Glu arginylyltransferase
MVYKDLKRLFDHLNQNEVAKLQIGESVIDLYLLDSNSKISLQTQVYNGGNYIPKSVRKCITQKAPFDQGWMKPTLTIDEDRFQIFLNYTEFTHELNGEKFVDLLEEFSWQADEWREYLDEHDKHDLVHVRVK